jgi:DNA helicase HerA-like ATPase
MSEIKFSIVSAKKIYILGRRNQSNSGLLNLGRYLALDGSLGAEVYFDALHPHVILICGKRGYGKSYSLGVIAEELASLDEAIKDNLAFLIIDTMGIFWTMSVENWREEKLLKSWNFQPGRYDLEIFVPSAFAVEFEKRGVKCSPFSLKASSLDAFDWCSMLNISPLEPLGVLIIRTIQRLKETGEPFSIKDIASYINQDKRVHPNVRAAAENYLLVVQGWGVFDKHGTPLSELIKRGRISILDLSCYGHALNIKSAIVATIARQIYDERLKARRNYLLAEMKNVSLKQEIPMVWLFIDEAHIFLPRSGETLASRVIVNEWLRLGRQPGLSLVLATQTLASLHREAISHCDLLICHRLTAQEDIEALSEVRPIYMRDGIVDCIKKLGQDKGAALLLDDTTESMHIVKIRPRKSWHGGGEPNALEE